MKKRYLAPLAAMVIGLCIWMCGCGDPEAVQPEEQVSYEIALVTDDGLINDGGHSEAAWTAITRYAASHGISHKYYKAVDSSDAAYAEVTDAAVANGAKLVIADGSDAGNVILKAQEKYPDVDFVMIDGEPVDEKTGDFRIAANTAAIEFDSAQAGFLAGYAAVVEGYSKLGFIGETDVNDSKNYGLGFLKGVDMASWQAGETAEVRYAETAESHDSVRSRAAGWYGEGTELIFVCGQDIDRAVIEAAEAGGGKVIAAVSDKNEMSDSVITSAVQNIDGALTEVLELYGKDKFPGGEVLTFNVKDEGVGLSFRYDKLQTITTKEYNDMVESLEDGEIKLDFSEIDDVKDMQLKGVTIL